MKRNEKYLVYGGLVLFLLLITKMGRSAWYTITDWLIPEFEGFRAHPYWDNGRWSWGYGTQAPGGTGTITKEQALKDMRAYLQSDYLFLKGLITRPLNANQWAALLSFSYNLGPANADNLIANINAYDDNALANQWKLYINSNGSPSADLIQRRNTEWRIWMGNMS